MQQIAISRDGTPVAYERCGSGPALILVHGTMGRGAFGPPGGLAALLSDSFTVFGYDRRGGGDAGGAEEIVRREVDDIAALIGAAGGRAFLFGVSSGAVPALEAAARGLAVAALALYEPPFVLGGGRAPLPADYARRVGALAAEGRRAEAVDCFLTEAVGVPAGALEPIRRDPCYALMQDAAHTLAYDGVLVAEAMSGAPLPARRWDAVRVPVLVASGERSEPLYGMGSDALAAVLSDVRRTVVRGEEHVVRPEAIAPVLRGFFTEMAARS
ncbi:alpha/beta fold hydrolase [Nocardiopsis potens]|uniref:alpha/beta fold hydrolase n=1 Tax=Nocardiopsis potens TaxID=1246458 RepID=UPI000347E63F|nr:alpha/beta hydrolase [Nocardiopsis potens]